MNADYLTRPILLHICKDGTVTYRTRNQKIFNGVALPFFSVETEEEAMTLQVSLCSKQYEPHPKQKDRPWYVFPRFSGEIEGIDAAADRFAEIYAKLKDRKLQTV